VQVIPRRLTFQISAFSLIISHSQEKEPQQPVYQPGEAVTVAGKLFILRPLRSLLVNGILMLLIM